MTAVAFVNQCSPIDGQDRGHVLWAMGSVRTHGAKVSMPEAAVVLVYRAGREGGAVGQNTLRAAIPPRFRSRLLGGAPLADDGQMAAASNRGCILLCSFKHRAGWPRPRTARATRHRPVRTSG